MIAFSTQSGSEPAVPPWLADWQPRQGDCCLVHRDLADGWHMVGIGDPLVFADPRRWADCGEEGWRAALIRGTKLDPTALAREIRWVDSEPVQDLCGRTWLAPIIRLRNGTRGFRVAYGRDWLPALTPEQARAEEIVDAARSALLAQQPPDMAVACQWAAELLSITHHVTPGVLAALNLLDEALVVAVLSAATSIPLEKALPAASNG